MVCGTDKVRMLSSIVRVFMVMTAVVSGERCCSCFRHEKLETR